MTFLSSLVGEMSGNGRNKINLGQTIAFHRHTHSVFEKQHLSSCLEIAMSSLSLAISSLASSPTPTPLAVGTVSLTVDILSWEYGPAVAWASLRSSDAQTLIKPPKHFKQSIIRPDILTAIFNVYMTVRSGAESGELPHLLRQLILQLSSISGPIFDEDEERTSYCSFLVTGVLTILSSPLPPASPPDYISSELLGVSTICLRLVSNFKLKLMARLPTFPTLLTAVVELSNSLLSSFSTSLETAQGDMDALSDGWKLECYSTLVEFLVMVVEDPFLLMGPEGEECRQVVARSLSGVYGSCVQGRIRIGRAEETRCVRLGEELDEVGEDIEAADLEEQVVNVSCVGRMNLLESLSALDVELGRALVSLRGLFESGMGEVNEEAAALLEEVRLMVLFVGHLLTDEIGGETPVIPESITSTCETSQGPETIAKMGSVVNSLARLAEFQANKISTSPASPLYSPLLGSQLLWFFTRFCPPYLLPSPSLYSNIESNPLYTSFFGSHQAAQELVNTCTSIAVLYLTSWPGEPEVVASTNKLLFALCRGNIRGGLEGSEGWKRLAGGKSGIDLHPALFTPCPNSLSALLRPCSLRVRRHLRTLRAERIRRRRDGEQGRDPGPRRGIQAPELRRQGGSRECFGLRLWRYGERDEQGDHE